MKAKDYARIVGISPETAEWWLGVCEEIGLKPGTCVPDSVNRAIGTRPAQTKILDPADWMKEQIKSPERAKRGDRRLSAMQEVERMVGVYKGVKKTNIPMGGKPKTK